MPSSNGGRSIGCTHSKCDDSPNVSKYGVANLRLKLREVLMRQDHRHAILSQLGEHVRECMRGESLEFVKIDEEIPTALFWLRASSDTSKRDVGK